MSARTRASASAFTLLRTQGFDQADVLEVARAPAEALGQDQVVEAGQGDLHAGPERLDAAAAPHVLERHGDAVHGRHGPRDEHVDPLVVLEHVATARAGFVRRASGDQPERLGRCAGQLTTTWSATRQKADAATATGRPPANRELSSA